MYRYQFTSTIRDLLDAEEAESGERLGLRKSLRWAVALIAGMGLAACAEQVTKHKAGWETIGGLAFAGWLVYHYLLGSYVRGYNIRRGNPPTAEVCIEFAEDEIIIDAESHDEFTREWNELADVLEASKGILLTFTDGVMNWLPNRLFADKSEKQALAAYLRTRQQEPPDT